MWGTSPKSVYYAGYSMFDYLLHCSAELGSGIVSTALQCGSKMCPTDDLVLNTSVQITIEHSELEMVRMFNGVGFLTPNSL
jgi:hypothetical protein